MDAGESSRTSSTRSNNTGSHTLPSVTSIVVAHQGGWDEALFLLVPIAVFALLLAISNRRH